MTNTSSSLENTLEQFLRQIIREEVKDLLVLDVHHEADHLLDANEAAKLLSISPDWLYRHAGRLPFTRKLGPKMLRFSYQGIQKYLASRKSS